MASADGLSAAAAAALAEAGPILPDPAVQLPLLDAWAVDDARAARPDRDADGAVQQLRKAGRPRGVPNKRTAAMRDYLLSRYPHPAEVLAQVYSRPVEVLAAELGVPKGEAAALQVKAAAELLPYIESKMPVAVDVANHRRISLVIESLGGAANDGEAGGSWLLDDLAQAELVDVTPVEQKQGVAP